MAHVTFYKVEVKYTGSIEDYTIEQLREMADQKVYSGGDPFDHTEEVTEEEARALDGNVWIEHKYPLNKLVNVWWVYKEDETEEE